jgi:hypothetical protein
MGTEKGHGAMFNPLTPELNPNAHVLILKHRLFDAYVSTSG